MKEAFAHKKFGEPALEMLEQINTILDDYESQGYDLSLRQLYYQLVSRNIVPNTERSYKKVGTLVSDARLAGLIDWGMISDRGRECVENPHWEDAQHFMDSVCGQFRLDLWEGQPEYVEVMVEKQALEGVLLPVCRKYDVPFTANKGYSSSSALYEAGRRFANSAEDGKGLHVVYLGDHDPSGIDMSRDVDDRVSMFSRYPVRVHRVALNMDQVEEMQPPENPAKLSDSRASGYIQRFGYSSWELDAIEPARLANIVEDAIVGLLDYGLFEERRDLQEGVRKQLKELGSRIK